MGDPSKFANLIEYQVFNVSITLLVLSELAIVFATEKGRKGAARRADNGTRYLVMAAFYGSLILAFVFRSSAFPGSVGAWLLPDGFSYAGIALILAGIAIRVMAVWKLKRAFTLSVQTTDDQRLVTDGLYRIVRNPAYAGSILGLIGVALALRHTLSLICVTALCLIAYGIRIRVEEKALETRFGDEFRDYCVKTRFRLFPGIF
jgi:protein-S-isoprenylcysteine O-methyltransferase Ste14